MKFEDRITAFAQRAVAEQNASLHVPDNPMKQNRHYWGWIATPAAAILGIVFGLSYHNSPEISSKPIAQVIDTVLVPQVQRDTLWLTRVEKKEHVIEKTKWREREPETTYSPRPFQPQTREIVKGGEVLAHESSAFRSAPKHVTPLEANKKNDEPICTSVSCDGIDYGMLASN